MIPAASCRQALIGARMSILRLFQRSEGPETSTVDVALSRHGSAEARASARITLQITARDFEDFRWYFEEYLLSPNDPAPAVAQRVVARMRNLGEELFRQVFDLSPTHRQIWAVAKEKLNEVRVELEVEKPDILRLPWELMCETGSDQPIALQVSAFVRASTPVASPQQSRTKGVPLRLLMIVARPDKGEDVPYRSIAGVVLQGLKAKGLKLDFEFLRPPDFGRLQRVLDDAHAAGKPYSIVHFDGHGAYLDPAGSQNERGYILFENSSLADNKELVHGELLGETLAASGVRLLLLNACRSAHATSVIEGAAQATGLQLLAFGSLAEEVLASGVSGVLAMSYDLRVDTAALFIPEVYVGLASGLSLGEAVSRGRRILAQAPIRMTGLGPLELQDWAVPIAYENDALVFEEEGQVVATASMESHSKCSDLWKRKFYDRDEVLLHLDRAFDEHRLVSLSGDLGSGKTATAAEFALWYSETNAIKADNVLYLDMSTQADFRSLLSKINEFLCTTGEVPETSAAHREIDPELPCSFRANFRATAQLDQYGPGGICAVSGLGL
jgi:hypothetical protein